jgi:tetratricopeptide (TPR) repeat protein
MDDDPAADNPNVTEDAWRRLATAFVDEILLLEDEEARDQRVRELARAEPWSVSLALLDSARSSASSDPTRAITLARLAVLAAEEMDPGAHTPTERGGLLALAFCRLADAQRLAGRYPQAEKSFARASSYLSSIARDDLPTRRLYLELLAELRFAQGREVDAHDLLTQAGVLKENPR